MTQEQIKEHAKKKVHQAMQVLKTLNLEPQARQRVSKDGFIEQVIFWLDHEEYQTDPVTPIIVPAAPLGDPEQPAVPTDA